MKGKRADQNRKKIKKRKGHELFRRGKRLKRGLGKMGCTGRKEKGLTRRG